MFGFVCLEESKSIMKTVKVSELTGDALDWAVAKCEGHTGLWIEDDLHGNHISRPYTPSTDWSQGGPIIEREGINLFLRKGAVARAGTPWLAYTYDQLEAEGPTPLVAAMRCYCASKLGDNIDIPEELT